ncbi:MAG: hypothetical protein QF603_05520 [Alphaproteobacteria bacterium]|nr:hypothetical protein [Alphaproteobacteria bacterium]MDP7055155.1 hypothetical protein [Alphaproteobacteria bacterium]MDP7228041.1 hypothetical protein [Alphaproteobacteria bacterium]MDP7459858.1 hypothetical protein [Alphaproteobacteria bacterium]HJM90440.1 hypothetical protein [Alphaproteobacteria bacterium]|tara:strand:- start:7863 stop:8234 length:372 start_codon:yes stop_codon:yes gene_type:complete
MAYSIVAEDTVARTMYRREAGAIVAGSMVMDMFIGYQAMIPVAAILLFFSHEPRERWSAPCAVMRCKDFDALYINQNFSRKKSAYPIRLATKIGIGPEDERVAMAIDATKVERKKYRLRAAAR